VDLAVEDAVKHTAEEAVRTGEADAVTNEVPVEVGETDAVLDASRESEGVEETDNVKAAEREAPREGSVHADGDVEAVAIKTEDDIVGEDVPEAVPVAVTRDDREGFAVCDSAGLDVSIAVDDEDVESVMVAVIESVEVATSEAEAKPEAGALSVAVLEELAGAVAKEEVDVDADAVAEAEALGLCDAFWEAGGDCVDDADDVLDTDLVIVARGVLEELADGVFVLAAVRLCVLDARIVTVTVPVDDAVARAVAELHALTEGDRVSRGDAELLLVALADREDDADADGVTVPDDVLSKDKVAILEDVPLLEANEADADADRVMNDAVADSVAIDTVGITDGTMADAVTVSVPEALAVLEGVGEKERATNVAIADVVLRMDPVAEGEKLTDGVADEVRENTVDSDSVTEDDDDGDGVDVAESDERDDDDGLCVLVKDMREEADTEAEGETDFDNEVDAECVDVTRGVLLIFGEPEMVRETAGDEEID
jgi:hypothetical protein